MANNEDIPGKIEVLSRLRYHKIGLTERMKQAFLNVPREEFVLEKHKDRAYDDTPLPILSNQTISAIHMVMIYISPSCTDPQVGDKILEVGAGSGYHAAMFAEMVAPKGCDNPGHVYAIEIVPELVKFAKENIEKAGYSDRVSIIGGDGGVGHLEHAPYDIVSVAAAGKRIPPPLLDQVAIGGKIVLPLGRSFYQELILMTKEKDGSFSEKNLGGVAFVPLTGKYG
ncbi:MAG: protein-L-isoaspartate O-methyltransferase [Candidatus Heimdallarchaeota archaeon]|nr:protein-L-isoaspartate O-methyltransferase [Candidatus Heimdallarchaeota archaeon]